jgi:hypothetical protein
MVNSQPLRTYLRGRDLELIFELIGEVDGHRVTYTPGRHLRRCARHGRRPDCPCLERLAALAGPIDLRAWWKTLGWRERRRQLQASDVAVALLAGVPLRPERREPPGWTWGLGGRLILAAALLSLLLLLAPLLHR